MQQPAVPANLVRWGILKGKNAILPLKCKQKRERCAASKHRKPFPLYSPGMAVQQPWLKMQGFSLIEMLVAMALSVIALLGLWEIYQAQRRTYYYGDGLMRIQENAHQATAILSNAIQHAGFAGCRHQAADFVIPSLPQAIQGYNASTGILEQLANLAKFVLLSDVIQVTGMEEQSADLLTLTNNQSLEASSTPTFKAGELAIVADCEKGELFQIEKVTTTANKQRLYSTSLLQKYERGAHVGQYSSNTFYVADSGRKNRGKHPIYSLYKQDSKGTRHELIEGVTLMRIYYGVRQANQPELHYYPAHQIRNWDEVQLVKVLLLLSSIEEVLQKPQSFIFDNQAMTQNNHQLYQPWTVTVFLKQRYTHG